MIPSGQPTGECPLSDELAAVRAARFSGIVMSLRGRLCEFLHARRKRPLNLGSLPRGCFRGSVPEGSPRPQPDCHPFRAADVQAAAPFGKLPDDLRKQVGQSCHKTCSKRMTGVRQSRDLGNNPLLKNADLYLSQTTLRFVNSAQMSSNALPG